MCRALRLSFRREAGSLALGFALGGALHQLLQLFVLPGAGGAVAVGALLAIIRLEGHFWYSPGPNRPHTRRARSAAAQLYDDWVAFSQCRAARLVKAPESRFSERGTM